MAFKKSCSKSSVKTKTKRKNEPLNLVDKPEAAKYIGVSDRSIQRYKDNGDLPFHEVGGLIQYSIADLDAFPKRFEGKKAKKRREATDRERGKVA
jgi:excisionase family DNA binding protein